MPKRIALLTTERILPGAAGGAAGRSENGEMALLAHVVAGRGHAVELITRRESPGEPETENGHVPVVRLPAGPAARVPASACLSYADEFTTNLVNHIRRGQGYDLVYADGWLAGIAAAQVKLQLHMPFVLALSELPRRRSAAAEDEFAATRRKIEQWLVETADAVLRERSGPLPQSVRIRLLARLVEDRLAPTRIFLG